jgi:hypothetical protein
MAATPPELFETVQRTNLRPLDEKTDVWQIAAIMFFLLTNGMNNSDAGPTGMRHFDPTAGRPGDNSYYISILTQDPGRMQGVNASDWFDHDRYPTLHRYSMTLKNICARCLNWNPNFRLMLPQFRSGIDHYLAVRPAINIDRNWAPLHMAPDTQFRMRIPFSFGPNVPVPT